jgi:hypothetical protein
MKFIIRTTLDRTLDKSYEQIPYELIIDKEYKPIDSFINALYKINDFDTILLEDDLILCKDFKIKIEDAIALYPNKIINFFQAPSEYREIQEMSKIVYNQCTYYPKGIAKSIADYMITLPRKEGVKKNMYSLLENEALEALNIKIIQYRPHLVQHLDNNTMLFEKTYNNRRSIYFVDYLEELGITYKESEKHQDELRHLMLKHFNKLKKQ